MISLIGTLAQGWLWVTVVSLALLATVVLGQTVAGKTVAVLRRLRRAEPVRVPVAGTPALIR
ncbi:MAG: hypothetical protein JWM62_979 [Frankiales bacterium]|jgi:hypothetical protein|nr:hypothetical protein [Frankiales bacterium]